MKYIPDRIEEIEGARIQHGPLNRRIYLMKEGAADTQRLIAWMERLAAEKGYTKIFAKVSEAASGAFLNGGYEIEAAVPGFFGGRGKALFLCKYLLAARHREEREEDLDRIRRLAERRTTAGRPAKAGFPFRIRPCGPEDAVCMAHLYERVFPSYPFPIDRPDYLSQTMAGDVRYFGVEHRGKLIALSSAEMDRENENAEMTDFATTPEWQGNGFAFHLLEAMEKAMKREGIQTAYTIARAVSAGINIVFAGRGYRFGGRLINNTHISGCIESMNVWYKSI